MSISVDVHRKLESFQLDISFRSDSRRIGILGASGCGKSMTLKSIAGIETPDDGRIEIEGRVLFDKAEKVNLKPQKRNVGYLFQNYALFPTMSVEKNIAAGLRGSREEKEEKVRQMVEKFRLEGLEKRLPGHLSGGQQQRVACARIMAYEPDVILLDEPFSALDMYLKDQLQKELIEMLEDYKGTVIMVSHNRDEVYRISDHISVMADGHVDCFDEKKRIFEDPYTYQSALLTGCKNFSRAEYIDESHVLASDWNSALRVTRPVSGGVKYIGLRTHYMHPSMGQRENVIVCDVLQAIEDLHEMILLLQCGDSDSSYSELHITMAKDEWNALEDKDKVSIYLEPDTILVMDR